MSKPSPSLAGRRVRLVHCNDTLTKLAAHSEGTVDFVDDTGTLHVKWDNGTHLGLCWDAGDRWAVLPQKK